MLRVKVKPENRYQGQKPRYTNAERFLQQSISARAGLPHCETGPHGVSVRIDIAHSNSMIKVILEYTV